MSTPMFEIPVIKIESEEQLAEKFIELAHVLHNLRFYEKYWNEHYGCDARRNMKKWQKKADDLLDSLGLTLHNNINAVKVVRS